MSTQKEIRSKGKKARRSLSSEERKSFSEKIVRRIADSPLFLSANNIMIYAALEDEVDLSSLRSLKESSSKCFYYPRVQGEDMIAISPYSLDAWTTGSFGIREPDPTRSTQAGQEQLDLVICPCTSFDKTCSRVGMGGGYYDRFLPKCINAAVIAVAFECQKAENIPIQDTDIRMDAVFTEKTVYAAK